MKLSFEVKLSIAMLPMTIMACLKSWTVRRLFPYPCSHQSTLVDRTIGMHHHAQAPNHFSIFF